MINDNTNVSNLEKQIDNSSDPVYATKEELNSEALIRAQSDEIIIDEFKILRKAQNDKIIEIDDKLSQEQEKVSEIDNQLTEAQGQIKENQDKIAEIGDCFLQRINELEIENQDLNLKLEEANTIIVEKDTRISELTDQITILETEKNTLQEQLQELESKLTEANGIILEKDEEIRKLRAELADNGMANDINLRFAYVPEFEVSKIASVQDFIDLNLKNLIVSRMEVRYPETKLDQDYRIILEGLDGVDVMQGRDNIVLINAISGGQLIGSSSFDIKVTYHYDSVQQEEFIEQFLQPAIPVSLKNVPENVAPEYNIPTEIANTKPLKLLLYNKEFNHYPFKIYGEMNAASYWTDFQRTWQSVQDGYVGTGQSTIGGELIINNIKNLHDNTSGYHNNIFKMIEQRINDSGVTCTLTKKWARTTRSPRVLHTFGNLTFNILDEQIRTYYMMVNFEIDINGVTKFYRGVTLALTDTLELY